MRQRVVIVGGGVAGLSAAHELAERDFEVHVYERRTFFGGKAASVRRNGLPVEHGFRFYPGWYRHLPDTMKRIPYRGKQRYFQGQSVFDNLTSADADMLTWYAHEPVEILIHPPRNLAEWRALLALPGELRRLGLTHDEIRFFIGKLMEFVATPEAKRVERYDGITWWKYMDADNVNRSEAFRNLVAATTRTMVAAKATEASAYTIANLAVRTLFDMLGTVDRVMNGPTSEIWIKPWVRHLKSRGVRFHLGQELNEVVFDAETKTISSLRFESMLERGLSHMIGILGRVEAWQRLLQITFQPIAARTVLNVGPVIPPPPDTDLRMLERAASELKDEAKNAPRAAMEARSAPARAGAKPHRRALWLVGRQMKAMLNDAVEKLEVAAKKARVLLAETNVKSSAIWTVINNARQAVAAQLKLVSEGKLNAPSSKLDPEDATALDELMKLRPGSSPLLRRRLEFVLSEVRDAAKADGQPANQCQGETVFFVFALPIEQMSYYINRSAMMTHYDPALRRILLLAEHIDWMAGIQFFLAEPVNLVAGHIACIDSEWGLTAIEHMQYWRDVELPPDVKAILSVDIGAWDRKGRFNQKEAFNCNNREIAAEVWEQLKGSVNRAAKAQRLRDDMLRGGTLSSGRSFVLDKNLVDLMDRKKQAGYEKARSVRFSADELMRWQARQGRETDSPYVWGRRLRFNVEPLLINRVGTHALRPDVRTAVPNMFLASDYVRTNTDLACMESANEAARRATNAILDAAGSSKRRCEIWSFSPPHELMQRLIELPRGGQRILHGASRLGDVLTGAVGRFAGEFLERRRSDNE